MNARATPVAVPTARTMGVIIGNLMREAGINSTDLAFRTGLTSVWVQEIVSGRGLANARTLDRMAAELGYRFVVTVEPAP